MSALFGGKEMAAVNRGTRFIRVLLLLYIEFNLTVKTLFSDSFDCKMKNKNSGTGSDYGGMVSKTKSDLNCQAWNVDSPNTVSAISK